MANGWKNDRPKKLTGFAALSSALLLAVSPVEASAAALRGPHKGSCQRELAVLGLTTAVPVNLFIDRAFVDRQKRIGASGARNPGAPDLFDSPSLPVSRTPYDARWETAAGTFLNCADRETLLLLSQANVEEDRVRISLVNSLVNRLIAFSSDGRNGRAADRWAAAPDTLKRREGDCEDFAIAKMAALIALGFSPQDLYFTIVKDLVNRTDHAVVAVRLDGEFFVLDSNTDRILESGEVRDYRPVFTLSFGRSWLHGAPRRAPDLFAGN